MEPEKPQTQIQQTLIQRIASTLQELTPSGHSINEHLLSGLNEENFLEQANMLEGKHAPSRAIGRLKEQERLRELGSLAQKRRRVNPGVNIHQSSPALG